jgi:hypothetical protein
MGRALAEEIPQAKFVEVNASGHGDIARASEAVEAIRSFCDSL